MTEIYLHVTMRVFTYHATIVIRPCPRNSPTETIVIPGGNTGCVASFHCGGGIMTDQITTMHD